MKTRFNLPKKILTACAVLTVLTGLLFTVYYRSGSNRPEEPSSHRVKTGGIPDGSFQTPVSRSETERKLSNETSLKQKGQAQIDESRTHNEPNLPAVDSTGTEIVEGVGLTVDQLRTLHAEQQREFESLATNSSFQAAAPDDELLPDLSIQDLLALHEEQRNDLESDRRVDEVVIEPLEDGTPGITVAELIALHEQQDSMYDDPQNLFEEVPAPAPANEDSIGYDNSQNISEEVPAPAPVNEDSIGSVGELMDLQDHQWEQEFTDLNEIVSPPPEDGGPGLTFQQVKELHESQGLKGK